MILGVCEKLERKTGIDATIFRVGFIVLSIACFGTGLLAYFGTHLFFALTN